MQISELKQKWQKLTSGWFGNVVYIFLGFLIAIAVNETLKPVLGTDTPVVAVFSNSMLHMENFDNFWAQKGRWYEEHAFTKNQFSNFAFANGLAKGDMVFIQGGEVKLGDIVVYDAPGYSYSIIHRVIQIKPDGIVTKGDNNDIEDPWTTPLDKIHGKAVLVVPLLGWPKVGTFEATGLA